MSVDAIELLNRWRAGDEQAAEELFRRYVERLVGLVRAHLSEKLARRFDPEDVVQSACRSFFVGTRNGRFIVEQGGDLWRILVAITLHKLHHQIDRHTAAKRNVSQENYFLEGGLVFDQVAVALIEAPSVDHALTATQEIEEALADLGSSEQRMLELRLEGYTLDEIANDVGRSQRTVRRAMERVRERFKSKYPELLRSVPP